MLPTEKASKLYISGSLFAYTIERKDGIGKCKNQHLYILSTDEIKKGNWYLWRRMWGSSVWELSRAGDSHIVSSENHLKIISSTDKEITPNSWIPESFVQIYIKTYNKGKPITEVSLEYQKQVDWDNYSTIPVGNACAIYGERFAYKEKLIEAYEAGKQDFYACCSLIEQIDEKKEKELQEKFEESLGANTINI